MTETKIFIRGKEIVPPEGWEIHFVCDRESGFKVTFTREETKDGTLNRFKRSQATATYYDAAGQEVARVEHDSGWEPIAADTSILAPDWDSKRGQF